MPGAVPTTAEWPGLTATLAGADDAWLARLLALRPDLVHPAPRDLVALAARVGAWPSARDSYASLDRAAQHVVEALCLLPERTTAADVAGLLGVHAGDADLAAALDRLEERALTFRVAGGGGLRLLPGLRQLDHPARLGPPLAAVLQSLTGPALEQVAQRLGARPARVKADTLDLIVGILADPAEVARLVEQGPAGTVELARHAAVDGPGVHVPHGLYGVTDRTPAGWMVNRGMLVVADYFSAVMPREPAVALRGGRVFPPSCLRRPPLDVTTVDPGAVDRAAAERATGVVADIVAILDAWSAEPPPVLKAGGIGIREIRKAAKLTDRTETETARVIELAAVAGLARADLLGGHAAPTAAYDEWLAVETPDRWAWLATSWLDATIHLNLAGAISTKDKPIPPLLARDPEYHATRRRRVVCAVLAGIPAGSAASPASARDRAAWTSPGVWSGGPATPSTLISWSLDEADLLGVSALGSLSTAGRAVLEDRTRDAASALAALVPPAVAEFVIQADLTAVIAGEPAPAVRTELALLGDVESKGAATVYRFSEASLRRAFDAGRTAGDIVGFFERHATRGVPQPLAYLIADLGRRFGTVRVGGAATYLRSDDEALLAEILQARGTGRLRLRALAPTVLVTDADAATVTSTLQSAGYLPAREGADGGLLLARPAVRRVAARPFTGRAVAAAPDLADIVADLRRAPAPQPAAPAAAPLGQPSLPLGPDRPTAIVKDQRTIRALLDGACSEYWVVRMSYVGTNGHASELTVEPTDLDGRHLYATCFPAGNERRFRLDMIEWARVLTEAEEDLLP